MISGPFKLVEINLDKTRLLPVPDLHFEKEAGGELKQSFSVQIFIFVIFRCFLFFCSFFGGLGEATTLGDASKAAIRDGRRTCRRHI